MANKNANYRKLNDGSHNSSTYHKKDGTNTRAILKREAVQEIDADTWAESGGTGGMFGRLHAKGLLRIVPVPDSGEQIVPKL